MPAEPSARASQSRVVRALKEAALTGLLAVGLFLPLVAFTTVNAPVPVLDWKPLSPPKLADTALAYDPALIPVRTPLTVAIPLAPVVPLPAGFPFS